MTLFDVGLIISIIFFEVNVDGYWSLKVLITTNECPIHLECKVQCQLQGTIIPNRAQL